MKPEERDELLVEIATTVIGIKGSGENGMAGDVREIKEHLARLNGQVHNNTTFRKIGTWISGAVALSIIALLCKIFSGG